MGLGETLDHCSCPQARGLGGVRRPLYEPTNGVHPNGRASYRSSWGPLEKLCLPTSNGPSIHPDLGLPLGLNAETPVSGLETCLQPKANLSCCLGSLQGQGLSSQRPRLSPHKHMQAHNDPDQPKSFPWGFFRTTLLLAWIPTGWDRTNQKGHKLHTPSQGDRLRLFSAK